MVKRIDFIELISVALCLIFVLLLSLFHISSEGYLGLTEDQWEVIWAISENSLSLISCILITIYTYGAIKKLFAFLFIPYFIVKLIYHISCFAKIYLFSKEVWQTIWSLICVLIIVIGLSYFMVTIINKCKTQLKN